MNVLAHGASGKTILKRRNLQKSRWALRVVCAKNWSNNK
jgi:hypothetical protein